MSVRYHNVAYLRIHPQLLVERARWVGRVYLHGLVSGAHAEPGGSNFSGVGVNCVGSILG